MSCHGGVPASLVVLAALAAPAGADCPRPGVTPGPDDVCRPWTAMLLPTAFATAYAPSDAMGPWLGGGVELPLLTWSDNSPTLGPSHGKVRFDIALLRGDEGAGTMVMYRGGAQVSFERNASRRWLIPYAVGDVGGLWTDATGSRVFVDAGVGVYLLHRRALVVDLEGAYVIPFTSPGELGGVRARVAVSFALW